MKAKEIINAAESGKRGCKEVQIKKQNKKRGSFICAYFYCFVRILQKNIKNRNYCILVI